MRIAFAAALVAVGVMISAAADARCWSDGYVVRCVHREYYPPFYRPYYPQYGYYGGYGWHHHAHYGYGWHHRYW